MIAGEISVLNNFILSWNLRNIMEDRSILNPNEFCIKGIETGEYPIDAWNKYFLEIPRDGQKKDISGRFNNIFYVGSQETQWNIRRTLKLPIYSNLREYNKEMLRQIIRHWDDCCIPDDIPCLAIAVKCSGFYSDWREGQYVTVLTIWNDGISRILSLEWLEGPLEDCITPEWYVETTSLLNLKAAITKMQNIYENTNWENPKFSIFTIPSCLGDCLKGEISQKSHDLWDCEWKYNDYAQLRTDMVSLLSKVQEIFFESPNEGDNHE